MNDLVPASSRALVVSSSKPETVRKARKKSATGSKPKTPGKPRGAPKAARKKTETLNAATMAAQLDLQAKKPSKPETARWSWPLPSEILLVALVLIAVTFYGATQTSTEIPTIKLSEPTFHELVRDGLRNALKLN